VKGGFCWHKFRLVVEVQLVSVHYDPCELGTDMVVRRGKLFTLHTSSSPKQNAAWRHGELKLNAKLFTWQDPLAAMSLVPEISAWLPRNLGI
jgi:hypothetical protein